MNQLTKQSSESEIKAYFEGIITNNIKIMK